MSVQVSAEFLGRTELDEQGSGHNVLKMCQRSGGCLPAKYLVNKLLGFYPCEINMVMPLNSCFHIPSVMAMLKAEYNHDEANDLRRMTNHTKDETHIYVRERLARVSGNIYVFISLGNMTHNLEFDKVKHTISARCM